MIATVELRNVSFSELKHWLETKFNVKDITMENIYSKAVIVMFQHYNVSTAAVTIINAFDSATKQFKENAIGETSKRTKQRYLDNSEAMLSEYNAHLKRFIALVAQKEPMFEKLFVLIVTKT